MFWVARKLQFEGKQTIFLGPYLDYGILKRSWRGQLYFYPFHITCFQSTGCPKNLSTVCQKNINKHKINSDSDVDTCNVLVDVSSTYPINIIEMS